jgi:hypothetical protein
MTRLFPRLRLSSLAGALAMVLVLLMPSPAMAWFGWLDEWSGPGGWFGVLIDVRLVCFGPQVGVSAAKDQWTKAKASWRDAEMQQRAGSPPTVVNAQLLEAYRYYINALNLLEQAQLRAGVSGPERQTVEDWKNAEKDGARSDVTQIQTVLRELQGREAQLDTMYRNIERHIEIQVGTGVFISLCSPQETRRASIEINANQWFTKDDAYVNNNLMWFSTIAPSFTWKVASRAEHDFLDIGASAGVYTVRAKGLTSFAGFVIEPIRADIHGPTAWHSSTNGWKRFASIVTLRAGLTMFPAGFEPGALAPTDKSLTRIKPELIPTYGIFFKAIR